MAVYLSSLFELPHLLTPRSLWWSQRSQSQTRFLLITKNKRRDQRDSSLSLNLEMLFTGTPVDFVQMIGNGSAIATSFNSREKTDC